MSDTSTPSAAKAAHRFGAPRQKVRPFAHYEGTSAWRKNRRRVREYNLFRAAMRLKKQNSRTPNL